MAEPYVGEIRMFGGNFAPAGWEFCMGQLMPISENEVLFALIGTTYGGDGQSTFALPDLRGRAPLHMGTGSGLQSYTIGETGGVEQVTLTTQQIPSHNHVPQASTLNGSATAPGNNVWAASSEMRLYAAAGAQKVAMHANALSAAGGSQPHENRPPFLVINFVISLFGVFPSQT